MIDRSRDHNITKPNNAYLHFNYPEKLQAKP